MTRHAESALLALLLVVTVVALGAADGGYYPTSWGWLSLGSAWIAMLTLFLRDSFPTSRAELFYLGALAFLCAWTAVSLLWTATTTQTVLEIQRTASYLAFAGALMLLVRRRQLPIVIGSLLTAIALLCAYGLATRFYPGRLTSYDPSGSYRLSEPVGYWNALALLAALGCVLGVGCAARARRSVWRGLAAATLPIAAATLYFTFGRAGWAALFLGLGFLLIVDKRRLDLVAALLPTLPWPALAVWRSYEASGLTTANSPIATATSDGRSLALTLLVLCSAAFVTTIVFTHATRGVVVPRTLRTVFALLLVGASLAAVAAATVAFGGPSAIVRNATDSIQVTSPNVRGDQTERLFSLSAHHRLDQWSVAVDGARRHPIVGMGAGAFEQWWLRTREIPFKVRDAHSLPLETAAELGVIGVLALLGVFLTPFVAGVRARSDPLVPVALAGVVVYIAHASADWDWEVPVVTVTALALAGALLVPGREEHVLPWSARRRALVVAPLAVTAVVSLALIYGNRALAQARAASDRDDTGATMRHARTAARWAPWSSAPVQLEADIALERGNFATARDVYREAIAKDPSNWELWFGVALSSKGAERRAALDRARALNPLATPISQLLGKGS
ncbi:MAG: O-antigen ligase family protein [Actinobacteria bacterium]|nr:O-antigen ligase family protein [Actinomycetota bacterium]